MGIIKNAIPILEFDTEQTAVISPVHENLQLNLPKKCVFVFLGNYIDEHADKSDTKQVSSFISATKSYPIYVTKYKGEEIVLCQAPVGAAAATQILEWLIGYTMVGAVNIRHYLNEYLLKYGGHIGDGIRPSERRKGYATKMISLALEE